MKQFSQLTKLAAVVLLGGTAFAGQAQNVVEENTPFTPAQNVVYSFTPSQSGELTINVNSFPYYYWTNKWSSCLYTSAAATEETQILISGYYSPADESYTNYFFEGIESGQTYYFKQDFYSGNAFTFTMGSGNEGSSLTTVTPSTTETFNYVTLPEIQLSATGGMSSFGEITLSYGNESVVLTPSVYGAVLNGSPENMFLQIGGGGYPAFKNLIATAAESGAQTFTITINDLMAGDKTVTGNLTGEEGITVDNGTVVLTYKILPAPKYLESASTWPETFYKEWPANDAAGFATLVFSQNIQKVGNVTLIMGPFSPGGGGGETPYDSYNLTDKVTVDGSNVLIDFTGVSRSASASPVTVIVENVIGANGLPADMSAYGTSLSLFQHIQYSDETAPDSGEQQPPVGPGPEEPEYMTALATQLNNTIAAGDPMAALELSWPEEVTLVNAEDVNIIVYYNTDIVGRLNATYINLVPGGSSDPGIATRAETGDKGSLMFILLGAAEVITEEGEYEIRLPEGILMNAAGEVNQEQMFKIESTGLATGVVTPESGSIFETGEDVIITITYDGVVEQNYSEDAPVIVTNYDDYDEALQWTPGVLYINENSVVINLGSELEEGLYYVDFREGQILVDGVENAAIEYMFTVGDDSTGINAIESGDTAAKTIYNLNGVKVNENNLGKGVYIINGKKVVIK